MYELRKLGEKTYYVDSPTRVGIYKINETDVCLIDSGNAPDAGKKVLSVCNENGWNIKYIINTHAHADHCGGNALLQKRTGCTILCAGRDLCLINEPTLNNSYCFGARPMKELCGKFLLAEKSNAQELTEENIPQGMQFFRFDGHSFSQVAILCDDGTCFIGDILCGRETIEKYHIFFINNVVEYIESVNRMKNFSAKVFCSSHFEPVSDKEELISLCDLNISKIEEIFVKILEICKDGECYEGVLKKICDTYSVELNFIQYAIAGSTIKGFLSYLHDDGKLDAVFEDNYLKWKTV